MIYKNEFGIIFYIWRMKKYRFLFFDLDRTLWDYEKNSSEAISMLFEKFALNKFSIDADDFNQKFTRYNDQLWEEYRQGRLHKDILRTLRFELCLKDYGIDNQELASELNKDYLDITPKLTGLISGANELMEYLAAKKYLMYIITNGFWTVQTQKLQYSGLNKYFTRMFTSEQVASNKPHRRIFEYAIKSVNAIKKQSLMIGDDLYVDVIGAQNFGIDQVYFNPTREAHTEKVTYEIQYLTDLMKIL